MYTNTSSPLTPLLLEMCLSLYLPGKRIEERFLVVKGEWLQHKGDQCSANKGDGHTPRGVDWLIRPFLQKKYRKFPHPPPLPNPVLSRWYQPRNPLYRGWGAERAFFRLALWFIKECESAVRDAAEAAASTEELEAAEHERRC